MIYYDDYDDDDDDFVAFLWMGAIGLLGLGVMAAAIVSGVKGCVGSDEKPKKAETKIEKIVKEKTEKKTETVFTQIYAVQRITVPYKLTEYKVEHTQDIYCIQLKGGDVNEKYLFMRHIRDTDFKKYVPVMVKYTPIKEGNITLEDFIKNHCHLDKNIALLENKPLQADGILDGADDIKYEEEK